MKNSRRRPDSILVLAATLACAVMASACVMDASPTPTPTGSKTTETDLAVTIPEGATVVTSPATNGQITPKVESAIGPSANGPVVVPPTPMLPRAVNGPDIDDPNVIIEDNPVPHPWDPDPNAPNGKPKIGGSEQTSGGSSSPPSTSGK